MDADTKRIRQCEASRRWKERNPDKVKKSNRKHRDRVYDPEKSRGWRIARLSRPGYRQSVNASANKRATSIRRWLDQRKMSAGCCDCGFNTHPSALHFDHVVSGKTLNVCNSKSIAQAEKEMAKCVVRCANCHAIRTWPNRLGHTSP